MHCNVKRGEVGIPQMSWPLLGSANSFKFNKKSPHVGPVPGLPDQSSPSSGNVAPQSPQSGRWQIL